MIIRKLEQCEHLRTRKLWEEVFPEDTKAFLDYYYYIKAAKNRIYVVEEEGDIRSMLQLNPYQIKMEEKSFQSEYIIAVATKKEYRSQGYMRALLTNALEEMYLEKMPFTFLMPAAEAIYRPYDFRFIYDQCVETIAAGDNPGAEGTSKSEANFNAESKVDFGRELTSDLAEKENEQENKHSLEFSDAGLWDAEEMADFFEKHFSDRWQVYAQRDQTYYQTMILEQQSEKGGVCLMRESGVLKGFYAYAMEDGVEVREPLYLAEYESDFQYSLQLLSKRSNGRKKNENQDRKKEQEKQSEIKVYASLRKENSKKRPVIMARIVYLPEFLKAMTVSGSLNLDCSFAVIDSILHKNSRVWRLTSEIGETEIHVKETEDSQGVFEIADLTEYLFGRISLQELCSREGAICTQYLGGEIEKIKKLTNIYLNEVV